MHQDIDIRLTTFSDLKPYFVKKQDFNTYCCKYHHQSKTKMKVGFCNMHAMVMILGVVMVVKLFVAILWALYVWMKIISTIKQVNTPSKQAQSYGRIIMSTTRKWGIFKTIMHSHWMLTLWFPKNNIVW